MSSIKEKLPLVLVVEDDEAARYMIREALEQNNFEVEEAHNGLVGIKNFKNRIPDIILSDVMMPHMDGFEFCAKIREEPAGAHVPILIMTALDDYESITQAYQAGATDFITKPINYLLLSHRLQYMLRAKRTADEFRISENRLANAQRLARIGHWELNMNSGQMHCSDALRDLLEIDQSTPLDNMDEFIRYIVDSDRDQYVNQFVESRKKKEGFTIEQRLTTGSGALIHVLNFAEYRLNPLNGEDILSGAIQDITRHKRVEQQVQSLSFYDKLTGLPNRQYFMRNLRQAIYLASRKSRGLAVLVLNLDRFERINNSLGYDTGDKVLLTVKQRLQDCIRKCDLVAQGEDGTNGALAHLGGDDFVVMITEPTSAEDSAVVARRITEALSTPIILGDNEVTITTSIGISIFPDDGHSEEVLMNNASTALQNAKSEGRNRFKYYKKEMNIRAFEKLSLEASLRRALEENQFELFYQPKMSLKNGNVFGAEALIRWCHPDLGMVSPAEFIPVAESSGLIIPIGEWVIAEAIQQLEKWQENGINLQNLSINLSARHVHDKNLLGLITDAFRRHAVNPALFEIEVTESMVMDNVDSVIPILKKLQATGLSISIDDFGTGYSSLAYLKKLPINTIKIDQSFVRELHTNEEDIVIVDAIIALSKSMKLKVVAEGVEIAEQAEILSGKGCDIGQGYFYSRPANVSEFEEWYLDYQACNKSVVNLKLARIESSMAFWPGDFTGSCFIATVRLLVK